MKLKKVFQRKETKYLMTEEVFQEFFEELTQRMSVDEYGLHTISSLYFDTDDDRFIRHSMDKPKYKEKFRVRAYGTVTADSQVFLEIKKKICGVVYKRRVPMSYQAYLRWLTTEEWPAEQKENQIVKEIDWLFARNPDLRPKVLICYDRLSLFDPEDENFRVTFDQRIRFRDRQLDLSKGSQGKLVAPEIGVLMEVKAAGAYPLWFVALLDRYQLRKASFSKYAQTYQRYLFNKQPSVLPERSPEILVENERGCVQIADHS